MIVISPSILAADFGCLGSEIQDILAGGADWVHFDVMDGAFVPNISIGVPVLSSVSKSVKAFYDVHLMIKNPLQYVEAFAKAGADTITFHIEAESDVEQTIAAIRALGVKSGITLKPKTPAEAAFRYLPLVDMVLVMTVEPGFGGQKFMADMCPKVAALRREANRLGLGDFNIEVDGGIDAKTVTQVAAAGANVFVAGSSVFGESNRAAAISGIRAAAQNSFCQNPA